MQIFINGINRLHCLQVNPSDKIEALKEHIKEIEALGETRLSLYHSGTPLEDDKTLADYDVESQSMIVASAALLGGAKKRKKKNYTTPKKNKHKKKKVKLAVLKFYKVDDTGKITRLRRECENKECGAGVFMANHFDRHYCGRCGLTLVYNKPEDK